MAENQIEERQAELNFLKDTYGNMLQIATPEQVEKHLANVNAKGQLLDLVVSVINFWMDHADEELNAEKADLALQKLSTILQSLNADEIAAIIEQIHEHEVKENLQEFLVRDTEQLLALYRSKGDEETLLRLAFLMNFIDRDNLLKLVARLDSQDLLKIIGNLKIRTVFERLLERHVKKGRFAEFLELSPILSTLMAAMRERSLGPEGEAKSDKILDNLLSLKMETSHLDELLDRLKNHRIGLHDLNMMAALRPGLLLDVVRNYHELPYDLRESFKEYVVPVLADYPLGKLMIEKVAKYDPALFNMLEKLAVGDTKNAERKDIGELLARPNSELRNAIQELDKEFNKNLPAADLQQNKAAQIDEAKAADSKKDNSSNKDNKDASDKDKFNNFPEGKRDIATEQKVKEAADKVFDSLARANKLSVAIDGALAAEQGLHPPTTPAQANKQTPKRE